MFWLWLSIFGCIGVSLAVPYPTPNCQTNPNINEEVDSTVKLTDAVSIVSKYDYIQVDGFQAQIYPVINGVRSPFPLFLNFSSGTIGPFHTRARYKDAAQCHNSAYKILKSRFKHDLQLSYPNVSAKFLVWESRGNLTYQLQPTFIAHILKGSEVGAFVFNCDVWSHELVDEGEIKVFYDETIRSTGSWIAANALRSAFPDELHSTPILSHVSKAALKSFRKTFTTYYCLM